MSFVDDAGDIGFSPSPDSDPPPPRPGYGYADSASSLENSIVASAAPTRSYSSRSETRTIGLSASATTPVGGAELGFGLYSNDYGMAGAYWTIGNSVGIPSLSLGIAFGKTQSLAGDSVSVSGDLGPSWPVSPGLTATISLDPTSGHVTGSQWGAALSVGPPIGVATAYTSTTTSEFTSLYLAYVQFINWTFYQSSPR
jgi:hypothetical protein